MKTQPLLQKAHRVITSYKQTERTQESHLVDQPQPQRPSSELATTRRCLRPVAATAAAAPARWPHWACPRRRPQLVAVVVAAPVAPGAAVGAAVGW